MFHLEELIERIAQATKLSKEEINRLIKEKQLELSGLVSQEGAAYIVAREHGINLLKASKHELKIKNIIAGMRSVDLVVRIINIFDLREFEKNGKKGKVINILIGDSTGSIRLPLWNEETDLVKNLKVNDTIRINKGWVKESDGRLELRLGKYGKLEKIFSDLQIEQKRIKDLKEGMFVSIRGCLVQKHEMRDKSVLSGILDDGTGNMRVVCFGGQAEKLFASLGKEYIVNGRVKRNKFNKELEFIVNEIKDVNVKDESENLIKTLESTK